MVTVKLAPLLLMQVVDQRAHTIDNRQTASPRSALAFIATPITWIHNHHVRCCSIDARGCSQSWRDRDCPKELTRSDPAQQVFRTHMTTPSASPSHLPILSPVCVSAV